MIISVKNGKLKTNLIFCLISFFSVTAFQHLTFASGLTAAEILSRVEKSTSPPQESAEFKMKVEGSNGDLKYRHIMIKRANRKKKQSSMVKIIEPRDLKGLALLSVNKDEVEQQWLYLPSSKRTRRIVGSGRKGRFLDSDLSYEDLSLSTYKNFRHKIIQRLGRGSKAVVLIESLAKKNSKSGYGKIKTWVSLKYFRVIKAEYFDRSNSIVKRMKFNKYKRYGRRYWRAKSVVVDHVQKKSRTVLSLIKLSLAPLADAEFSLNSLEDD